MTDTLRGGVWVVTPGAQYKRLDHPESNASELCPAVTTIGVLQHFESVLSVSPRSVVTFTSVTTASLFPDVSVRRNFVP
jgi:hypothetical protein